MPDPNPSLLDDFNRANTGPPPSSQWTSGVQTANGLKVVSNQLTWDDVGAQYRQGARWNVANFGPNVEIVVDLSAWTETAFEGFFLFVRLTGAVGSMNGYALVVEPTAPATTEWLLWRLDAGTIVTLGSLVVQSVAAGDQIALTAEGSLLRGWRKPSGGSWTVIRSHEDTTYNNVAGQVGIEITNSANVKLDNFKANTISKIELDYTKFPKQHMQRRIN